MVAQTGADSPNGAEPQVGAVLDQRYRLTELLRAGRTARTFLAERISDGRELIVKVVAIADPSDEEMGRLRREAAIGAILSHPRIATPIAVLRAPSGAPFLVYERPPGEELGALQKRVGRLGTEAVRAIVAQACDAIHAAHVEGVVHGDLRPATLLVDGEGAATRTLVIDYGIARLREARRPGASATSIASPALIGMASYMAPEQAHGLKAEAPSDQFALAAMAYELLMGKGPFGVGPTVAVLSRVLHADPPPMAGVAHALERVVLRGLAKSPNDRFPTVKAFGEAFEEAASTGAATRGGVSRTAPTAIHQTVLKTPEKYIETQVVPLPVVDFADEIPRNRPVALWGVLVGAAIFAALGIGVMLGGHGAPPPAVRPVVAPVASSPAAPAKIPNATVRIEFHLEPAGARVRVDGRPITPPVFRLPRSDSPLRVVAVAEGYLPAERQLVPSEDQVIVIRLTSSSAPQGSRPKAIPQRKPPSPNAPAPAARRGDTDLRDPFN